MLFRYGDFVMAHPEVFYLMIPLSVALLYILRKRFIKEELRLVINKGKKRITLVAKTLFFLLVLLALSTPYLEYKETKGNVTTLKVLIDRSRSMDLYDIESVRDTLDEVRKSGISVEEQSLDLQESSSIGNAVLNNLAPGQNILLISDGQNNLGPSLEDVSLFASSIDSRIFGVRMENEKDEAAVVIEGPSKVVSGVENVFTVRINEVGSVGKKMLKVTVDGTVVFENKYEKPVEIKKIFASGNHILKADLAADDTFRENNQFYKVINVYDKPEVLFVSKTASPLTNLYSPFYGLKTAEKLPESLGKYYAIILDNINEADLSDDDITNLDDFVGDGNGLFVVGGKESFDWGNYNASLISDILPVSVGKANKKKDIANVVILMDTGTSASEEIKSGLTQFDVQKILAADIIKSMASTNKVAMIEANYYLNTISGLSELGPKRAQLVNDISLLKPRGLSELRYAYQTGYEMLKLVRGSKSIVILTDGLFRDEKLKAQNLYAADQQYTIKYAEQAFNDNIKTYIIGVGEKADEEFLIAVKDAGGGEYFKINENARIKLYFGDPTQNSQDDLKLFVYDSNHFITKDLKELGKIYGFNSVYPKATARLLLTTSAGDPILTIWNYGIGRVAALTTDDGSVWVPELVSGTNSKVLIRTLNWLIEDPERKNSRIIEAPDFRLGENSEITVKTDIMPKSDYLNFYEAEKGIFKANFYPNSTGVVNMIGLPFAVNYKKEYLQLGINKDLEKLVSISGGEILDNDAAQIAEKIKSVSAVSTLKKIDLSWIFIAGAVLVYIIELFIRRLYEIKNQQ